MTFLPDPLHEFRMSIVKFRRDRGENIGAYDYVTGFDVAYGVSMLEPDSIGFITPRISLTRIDDVDGQIERLNFDIQGQAGSVNPAQYIPYFLGWRAYYTEWKFWKAQHQSELSRLGDQPMSEFLSLESQYNVFRARFVEIGGQTKSVESDVNRPPKGPNIPWMPILVIGGLVAGGYLLNSLSKFKGTPVSV